MSEHALLDTSLISEDQQRASESAASSGVTMTNTRYSNIGDGGDAQY